MRRGPSPVADRVEQPPGLLHPRRSRRRSSARASRPSVARALGQEGERLPTFARDGPRSRAAPSRRIASGSSSAASASMRAADARASSILPADAWACAARSGSPRSGAAAGARASRAATSSDRPERNASREAPARLLDVGVLGPGGEAGEEQSKGIRPGGGEAREARVPLRPRQVRREPAPLALLRKTIGPSRRAQQRPAVARLLEDLDGPFGRHPSDGGRLGERESVPEERSSPEHDVDGRRATRGIRSPGPGKKRTRPLPRRAEESCRVSGRLRGELLPESRERRR